MTTLIVLAAGLATRFGSAKQIEAVGPAGETLFDYAVFDAWRAGCTRVVFVIRDELRELFDATVVARWRERLDVELALQRVSDTVAEMQGERTKPWGTAHALLVATRAAPGAVIVCNADDFYGAGAYAALSTFLAQESDTHAVAGYRLAATLSPHGGVTRAVCRTDSEGLLERVDERRGIVRGADGIHDDKLEALDPDALVSMNLWAFRPAFFPQLAAAVAAFQTAHTGHATAELVIPEVVNQLLAGNNLRVRVIPVVERWFGMTFPADLPQVRTHIAALVRAGDYPPDLFAPGRP